MLLRVAMLLSLVSCATAPKAIQDIRIGESYLTVGMPNPALRECSVKAQNVATVMPHDDGGVEVLRPDNAIVCGEASCKGELVSPFQCVPLKVLKSAE